MTSSTGSPPPGRDWPRRTSRLGAALLGVAIVALVALVVSFWSQGDEPPPPTPAAASPTEALPSSGPTGRPDGSPSGSATAAPPAPGTVGDYRCLTEAQARERIEADGFVVGQVNATISGGAVDATWVVERQDPAPGSVVGPGGLVDLVISSPFEVCQ